MRTYLMLAIAAALSACGSEQPKPLPPEAVETNLVAAAPAATYTKAQFEVRLLDKTKAQVRAELGSPMTVHDDSDTWVYSSPPVYDAQAGTPPHLAYVRFAGMDGDDDFVAEVTYY